MSIRVMTAVWDRAQYEEGTLLVLLALADWADDKGGHLFPSIAELAKKSRLKERQVYNVLRRLREDGVITVSGGGGRGRRTQYQMHLDALGAAKAEPQGEVAGNPANIAGFNAVEKAAESGENPAIGDAETLQLATENPAIGDIPPHPPLGRTVREPSEGTVRKKNPPPAPARKRDGEGGGDPAFRERLEKAAARICEACGLTEPRDRKRLMRALEQYAAKEQMAPGEAAAAMMQAWRDYCDWGEMLRYRWGPVKFFTQGHWLHPGNWPVDEARASVAREARVGVA